MSNLEHLEIFCRDSYNNGMSDLEILVMAQAKITKLINDELSK